MSLYFDKVKLPTIAFPSLNSIQNFDMTALVVQDFQGQHNL